MIWYGREYSETGTNEVSETFFFLVRFLDRISALLGVLLVYSDLYDYV